jgi:hypothetical protein
VRILVAGDSQAAGLLRHLRRRLPVVAADTRSGRPTSDFLGLPELVRRARADVVILAVGGNDHLAQESPSAYRELVRGLAGRLVATGARVYWWGPASAIPADVDERHVAVAAAQQVALQSTGARWLDSRPLTRTGHGSDGVHFTAPALRRWAAGIARELRPQAPWGWLILGLGAVAGLLAAGAGRGLFFGEVSTGHSISPIGFELGRGLRRAMDDGDAKQLERLATRAAAWVWSEADRTRAKRALELASGLPKTTLRRLLGRGEARRASASQAM